MIRLLRAAAAARADHPAVISPTGTATYGELHHDARVAARALAGRGVRRLAIVEPDVGILLRVLAGAALAGVEVCQYQADLTAAEITGELDRFDAVLTRRTDLADGPRRIDPAELLEGEPLDAPEPDRQPLLIRTTGTTGTPKTARHDWLVLARTTAGTRPRPEQRWLMAYGPHQFAGIQVLQHVAASQATLVAPFPRAPRDGLRALVEHDVTCVSATPTFWRFLLAEARSAGVRLPALTQVTLGGEASPPDLLAELERTFPSARISHVYASTEFGSIASVRDGLPGFPVSALAGDDNPDAHLKVVDGELWVRARAGMLGYADDAGSEPAAEDQWRPTGDLVEVVDGRVLFRGRSSEVINVGGVKVHPLPVEERISALDTVALARVHGRPNPLTGAVVAVEVVPSGDADLATIRAQVKEAVADLPPAWRPRSVKLVEAVETRGDKTLRRMEEA
jgi:acyl-CoA synthetase (AMP-forming)/AMP-acid ligase II